MLEGKLSISCYVGDEAILSENHPCPWHKTVGAILLYITCTCPRKWLYPNSSSLRLPYRPLTNETPKSSLIPWTAEFMVGMVKPCLRFHGLQ